MHETSKGQGHAFVAGLARWWKGQVRNWAGRTEAENSDQCELRMGAAAVESNVGEFRSLAGKWPDSSSLLLHTLAAPATGATESGRSQRDAEEDFVLYSPYAGNEGRGLSSARTGVGKKIVRTWPH